MTRAELGMKLPQPRTFRDPAPEAAVPILRQNPNQL